MIVRVESAITISCCQWSSVDECQRVACAFISPVRTEYGMFGDVLYAVLYVCVSCFVVHGCAVSRRYINGCNCDMSGVVVVQCFPTGAPWSPCALRCITKGSAGDDIYN